MTEDLKKVAAAIGAELERQCEENRGVGDSAIRMQHMDGLWRIDGTFDLEKVARAALDAAS